MFSIRLSESAAREMTALRRFDQVRLIASMRTHLTQSPARPSRARKRLEGVSPSWEHVPPVWQLRVGDFRLLYDIDEDVVTIRAIRIKGRKTTGEIL